MYCCNVSAKCIQSKLQLPLCHIHSCLCRWPTSVFKHPSIWCNLFPSLDSRDPGEVPAGPRLGCNVYLGGQGNIQFEGLSVAGHFFSAIILCAEHDANPQIFWGKEFASVNIPLCNHLHLHPATCRLIYGVRTVIITAQMIIQQFRRESTSCTDMSSVEIYCRDIDEKRRFCSLSDLWSRRSDLHILVICHNIM